MRLGRDSSHETGELAREGGRARGRVIPPQGKGVVINSYLPKRIELAGSVRGSGVGDKYLSLCMA